MTATDVFHILAKRFCLPEWALLYEVRLGTGYVRPWRNENFEQRMDAFAINCYPSKDLVRIAFEIKVSRSDYLREIRNPQKRQGALELSNQFYIVAPPGIVRDDLPDDCGYIEVTDKARVKIPAPTRDIPDPPMRFVASLVRHALQVKQTA